MKSLTTAYDPLQTVAEPIRAPQPFALVVGKLLLTAKLDATQRLQAAQPRTVKMRFMDSKTLHTVIQIARYAPLLFFVVSGVYFWLVMLQSASFSAFRAEPLMSEIYATRALFGLPIALLMLSVGVLFFICLRPGKK